MPSPRVTLVVPCYNEASRLDTEGFSRVLEAGIDLLFVDDGSRDRTRDVLEAFAAKRPDRVAVVAMPANAGKGEAVRYGLSAAIDRGDRFVGFTDADLATPPEELARLVAIARAGDADVVVGSRVARAGARIERKVARHYLGRVFATYASLVLHTRIYDTQCGAKIFRVTPSLRAAVARPFLSRWIFDVELFGRLLRGEGGAQPVPPERILEVPLDRWADVAGSKLRPSAAFRIGVDMAKVAADLHRPPR